MSCWYAIHTKPNREVQAYRDIVRQGFAAFSPVEIVTAARRNAKGQIVPQRRTVPLCRGYVFSNVPFPQSRHIIGPLQLDGQPVQISDFELLPLRTIDGTERKINAPKRGIVLNEIVRVAVGRLAGITGKAIIVDGARVVIETDFFGTKRTVTVGKDKLKAVEAA